MAQLLKIRLKINLNSNKHSIQLDIFELRESSQKSGSKYWEVLGKLLEAEDLLLNNETGDIKEMLLEIMNLKVGKNNFEIQYLSNLLYLKLRLKEIDVDNHYELDDLENTLHDEIDILKMSNCVIFELEYRLLLLQFYIKLRRLNDAFELLNKIISTSKKYNLLIFTKKLEKIKKNKFDGILSTFSSIERMNEILLLIPRS